MQQLKMQFLGSVGLLQKVMHDANFSNNCRLLNQIPSSLSLAVLFKPPPTSTTARFEFGTLLHTASGC